MRAELNRGQIAKKIEGAKQKVDDFKAQTLREAADFLAEVSPIDTGTYIDNHNIGVGNSVPVTSQTSSDGRTGYYDIEGLAYNPLAERVERDEARSRLWAQIEALPEGWKRASIGNTAMHFTNVEYGWPTREGYAVYTRLRQMWPSLKADAATKLGIKYG